MMFVPMAEIPPADLVAIEDYVGKALAYGLVADNIVADVEGRYPVRLFVSDDGTDGETVVVVEDTLPRQPSQRGNLRG